MWNYQHLLQSPQLVYQPKFEEICEVLDSANRSELTALYKERLESGEVSRSQVGTINLPEDTALLKVEGTLTRKLAPSFLSGGGGVNANYIGLINQAKDIATQPNVKRVVMMVDSGGGEAYTCFETAKEIKAIFQAKGIKLIGYNDGMAASAAYALLCVCDEVISNPDARSGSIGVVVSLMNNSGALEKAGYKRSFITAGANKVPFEPNGEFTAKFLEGLQKDVDSIYQNFLSHVSLHRNITIKQVEETKASVFRAEQAKEKGLIDKVMTSRQFQEYLDGKQVLNAPVSSYTKPTASITPSAYIKPTQACYSRCRCPLKQQRKVKKLSHLKTPTINPLHVIKSAWINKEKEKLSGEWTEVYKFNQRLKKSYI